MFTGCCLGYRIALDGAGLGAGCPFCPRLTAARQTGAVVEWIDSHETHAVAAGSAGSGVKS